MKNKRLIVKKLSRWPQSDESDELKFDTGLNVVVGEPHTGKSQWLKMFSFLMGDRDSNPSNAFDETLVNKYESIRGEFLLGNQSFVLQRSWKVRGQKTKVLVNDEPVSVDDFSSHILSKLDIPILQYPQGNPLSPRTWPTLSLQSLFWHIYRRQKSWDELASKQPVVEQYACLLQLLGIAKYRFSPIYKELVDKQKEIYRKQISRGQFISTLERISEEILDEQSLQTQLTSDSLKDEFTKLEEVTEKLIEKRTELLASFKKRIALKVKEVNSSDFAESEERLETLTLKREETLSEINRTRRRSSDLGQYAQRVSEELSRIERARSAGKVFRDLKITHCPACEQSVSPKNSDPDHCFLCGQEIIEKSNESNTSEQRLDFEIEQLNAENEEAQELVEATTSTLEKLLTKQKRLDEEIALVKGKMRVTQLKAASYLPQEFSQEISQIDIDLGRNQEKIKQLGRIHDAVELQENISDQVSIIEDEISELEEQVKEMSDRFDFDESASLLSSPMNDYIQLISDKKPGIWTQGEINLRLREKGFEFMIGNSKLASLSGTLTLYFMAAYNYALFSLSRISSCNYPGLCILEFPASISDGGHEVQVRDHENFILEPFAELMNQEGMNDMQELLLIEHLMASRIHTE